MYVCIYIYIIYTPNLGLRIAVLGRHREQGFMYEIDGLVGMALSKHGKTNYTSLFAQLVHQNRVT